MHWLVRSLQATPEAIQLLFAIRFQDIPKVAAPDMRTSHVTSGCIDVVDHRSQAYKKEQPCKLAVAKITISRPRTSGYRQKQRTPFFAFVRLSLSEVQDASPTGCRCLVRIPMVRCKRLLSFTDVMEGTSARPKNETCWLHDRGK